ncbi:ABC transporter substrate-binding protein [Georgenia alba]|uniref:ABC transporter substrate-binding protein n=1 Tax=Georgenia alba TaxID=2233858 RepID=A0ABW2Q8F4_9MICO
MKTTTRTLAVLTGSLAAASMLAACSTGPTDGGEDGAITLTFANADPAETWARVIEAYESEHPDVQIEQLNIPYEQYTSTINQRLAGGSSGIDLVVVDAGGAARDWDNRGFLADISDLRDEATDAAVSPDIVSSREVDGRLLALAPWTSSQFLYYNTDVLEAAGVEPPPADPTAPWTYEQLQDAARAVADAGAAQYPLLFDQWDTYYQLQMLGESAGGGSGIDENGDVDLTNDGWQHALTWYRSLFEEGLSPRGVTNDRNGALFQTGEAGFILSGPWGVSVANEGDISYGVAPAPYFEGGEPATSTDSWAVGVTASSQYPDAAKEFLRFITIDPEGNATSAEVAGITPTNAEAYAQYADSVEASAEGAADTFGEIMQHQLENTSVHRPNVIGYSVFEPAAGQAFSDIRNGADPAERAAQAEDEIEAQIERLR